MSRRTATATAAPAPAPEPRGGAPLRTRLLAVRRFRMNFLFGARLAKLDQDLNATYTNTTTIEEVFTRSRFEGAGLRTGLEGTWMSPSNGFFIYGNAYASFLAGKFRSSFVQQDNFAGTVVDVSYSDDRIVPVLDVELGIVDPQVSRRS